MALNNLGAAEMKFGEFGSARSHLEAAIAIDRQSPLPYFNLGTLARLEGNESEAMRLIEQAATLGYSRGLSDRLVTAAQRRFAKTDGRGIRQDDSQR